MWTTQKIVTLSSSESMYAPQAHQWEKIFTPFDSF